MSWTGGWLLPPRKDRCQRVGLRCSVLPVESQAPTREVCQARIPRAATVVFGGTAGQTCRVEIRASAAPPLPCIRRHWPGINTNWAELGGLGAWGWEARIANPGHLRLRDRPRVGLPPLLGWPTATLTWIRVQLHHAANLSLHQHSTGWDEGPSRCLSFPPPPERLQTSICAPASTGSHERLGTRLSYDSGEKCLRSCFSKGREMQPSSIHITRARDLNGGGWHFSSSPLGKAAPQAFCSPPSSLSLVLRETRNSSRARTEMGGLALIPASPPRHDEHLHDVCDGEQSMSAGAGSTLLRRGRELFQTTEGVFPGGVAGRFKGEKKRGEEEVDFSFFFILIFL